MEWITGPNQGAYYFFSFQSKQLPALTPLFEVANALGSYLVLGPCLLVALFLFRDRPRVLAVAFLTALAAIVTTECCRTFVSRARPDLAESIVGKSEMLKGYPSGTVLLSIVVYFILAAAVGQSVPSRLGKKGIYFLTFFILFWICLSQLWLTLHFFSDLLASLIGGAGFAYLFRYFQRRADPMTPGGAANR